MGIELDPEKFGADNPRDVLRLVRLAWKAAKADRDGRSAARIEQRIEEIQEDCLLRAADRQADRDTARRSGRRR